MGKFQPWTEEPSGDDVGYMIRVADNLRRSYGDFQWPSAGYVEAQGDTKTSGLYGLLDGLGTWGRLPRNLKDPTWQVVAVLRSECQADEFGGAVYAPRGWVVYSGDVVGAMQIIMPIMSRRAGVAGVDTDETNIETVLVSHDHPPKEVSTDIAARGAAGRIKTNGAGCHAMAIGGFVSVAVASGPYGVSYIGRDGASHATGRCGLAVARGGPNASFPGLPWSSASAEAEGGIAANFSHEGRARAGEGGAIVLVQWVPDQDEDNWFPNIQTVFASRVGENGIEPDTYYTLIDGKPVVADEAYYRKLRG